MQKAYILGVAALFVVVGGAFWSARRILTDAGESDTSSPFQPVGASNRPFSEKNGLRQAPGSSRAASQTPALPEDVWFREMVDTGIDFQHNSGNNEQRPLPAANGSGLAAFDYDLDGRVDLYFATGKPFPLKEEETRFFNRLYRNLGNWKFREASHSSRLDLNAYTAGVAVGDFDNDGFQDVYATCYGANCLFRNQGDGTFEKIEKAATDDGWATSAAFFDFNRDGFLDLYVCNYGIWTWETNRYCGDQHRGARLFCSPHSIPGQHDVFYQNNGDGSFRDVTRQMGLLHQPSRAQGVVAADLNDDGWIDIYVGNDMHANTFFYNEQGKRFRDASHRSGVAFDAEGKAQAGMGVAVVDANRDDQFDMFVTNFKGEHNAFYEALGDELFADVTNQRGLMADAIPWIGWGCAFVDFDLDGWHDLLVTNGHVDDNRHLMGENAPYEQPALLYRNNNGRFERVGVEAGEYFHKHHPGRGLAVADLDDDGDQDVVIGHQDIAPAMLRNEQLSGENPYQGVISIRLVGRGGNRDAVGASVALKTGLSTGGLPARQQVMGGGSYLSASDLRLVFDVSPDSAPNSAPGSAPDSAAGQEQPQDAPEIELQIRWPSGVQCQVSDLKPGRSYIIVEPSGVDTPADVFVQSINSLR